MSKQPITMPAVCFVPQKDPKLVVLYVSEDSWCASIYFLLGATPERYKAWVKEVFDRDDKDTHHHYFTDEIHAKEGGTADIIGFCDEIWDWNIQQMATLVHECHHATTNILMRKGIKHSRETEEVWAYLQDSIYQRICWAMKNRDKVKALEALTKRLYPDRRRRKKRPLARKRRRK